MSTNEAPAPPDYSPIANAQAASSAESMALAREQFAWAKETYAENKLTTDRVVDSMIATQDDNTANARADRKRYESIYQPLEDDLARDAADYANPAKRDEEIGRAKATVAQNMDAQRKNAQRNLEGYGVNPSASRFAALDLGVRAAQGAAEAAAGNQAGQMVDATGRALRSEAINVGRGYPGQVAGTYNTALQAGTGANNSNLATTASGANTMGTAGSWNSAANSSLNSWGNTLNQSYGNQMAGYNAEQKAKSDMMGGIGSMIGMGTKLATGDLSGSMLGSLMFAKNGGVVEHPEQVGRGNCDLSHEDTHDSYSFHDGKCHVLIPGRKGKRLMSHAEAVNNYAKTGKHMGKFASHKASGHHAMQVHGIQRTQYAADGGAITGGIPVDGGEGGRISEDMSPSKGAATDDVPAMLDEGEFIMPKSAVMWHGLKSMYGMIEKAQEGKKEAQEKTGAIPRMAPAPRSAIALQ